MSSNGQLYRENRPQNGWAVIPSCQLVRRTAFRRDHGRLGETEGRHRVLGSWLVWLPDT